ncbi:hypothetical protein L596_006445 [Steinernema carpocapsae]|uniref:Uncharacterized protein n=1 Tax=Steinernema carpocapsae TaxID=34508 RepID=A0A4U8V2B3_STECR|nr:hypothetical protein L596_006445 [Steinernema carpocapsae]
MVNCCCESTTSGFLVVGRCRPSQIASFVLTKKARRYDRTKRGGASSRSTGFLAVRVAGVHPKLPTLAKRTFAPQETTDSSLYGSLSHIQSGELSGKKETQPTNAMPRGRRRSDARACRSFRETRLILHGRYDVALPKL